MISFNTVKNFVNACLPTALTTMGVIGICVFGYSVKKGTEKHIAAKKKHEEIAADIEEAKMMRRSNIRKTILRTILRSMT